MTGPTGKIVLAWRVGGRRFRVEKLTQPVLRGAGPRPYRLWDDDQPCYGGQWHYDIAGAVWRADYVMHCRYSDRIRRLEHRVSELLSELARRDAA